MGYLAAALYTAAVCLANVLCTLLSFKMARQVEKQLKITIPESLDYTQVFDDLLERYTRRWELEQVKTCRLGSLYQLKYHITLRDGAKEKAFLDGLRCRNGNLEIVCGRIAENGGEL